MAMDIDKAIQALNDIDDAYFLWRRKQLSDWMDEYIGLGIDKNDPSTFDQDDVDFIKAVLAKLGSNTHAQLYVGIEDILAVMTLNKQEEEDSEKEENQNGEANDDAAPLKNAFNREEFQSRLEAEGWMTDDEWKKFGIRQGGVCISEKIMTDIASRWDDDRLQAFPVHSKFQYTDKGLPPGQAHYIITTFEWQVIMGHFSPIPPMPFSTGDNPAFVMWKLENGKNYVDWCKSAKLRNNEG